MPAMVDHYLVTTTLDDDFSALDDGPIPAFYTALGTSSGLEVSGHKITTTTDSTQDNYLVVDSGNSDCDVSASFDGNLGDKRAGVVFRAVDANNYLLAYFSSGIGYVNQFLNGTGSVLATVQTGHGGNACTVRVVMEGQQITVYLNGTEVTGADQVTGFDETASIHGAYVSETGVLLNNLKMRPFGTPVSVGGTQTTATITTLSADHAEYFEFDVAAVNSSGSTPAAAVSPTVRPGLAPQPVTNLTSTPGAQGSDSVTLTWTPPIDFGSYPFSHYEILHDEASVEVDGSGTTSYLVTGLPGGATDSITVQVITKDVRTAQTMMASTSVQATVPADFSTYWTESFTPDGSLSSAWTTTGTVTQLGGTAVHSGGGTFTDSAIRDTSHVDHRFDTSVQSGVYPNGPSPLLGVRLTDHYNGYFADRGGIYKRVNGAFTALVGGTGADQLNWANGDTLSLIAKGNVITLLRNGVQERTVIDSTFTSETQVGIFWSDQNPVAFGPAQAEAPPSFPVFEDDLSTLGNLSDDGNGWTNYNTPVVVQNAPGGVPVHVLAKTYSTSITAKDIGSADQEIHIGVYSLPDGGSLNIGLRYVSVDDGCQAGINPDGTIFVGGTTGTIQHAAGKVLVAKIIGTTASVTYDGETITVTGVGTPNTRTAFGVRIDQSDNSGYFTGPIQAYIPTS